MNDLSIHDNEQDNHDSNMEDFMNDASTYEFDSEQQNEEANTTTHEDIINSLPIEDRSIQEPEEKVDTRPENDNATIENSDPEEVLDRTPDKENEPEEAQSILDLPSKVYTGQIRRSVPRDLERGCLRTAGLCFTRPISSTESEDGDLDRRPGELCRGFCSLYRPLNAASLAGSTDMPGRHGRRASSATRPSTGAARAATRGAAAGAQPVAEPPPAYVPTISSTYLSSTQVCT